MFSLMFFILTRDRGAKLLRLDISYIEFIRLTGGSTFLLHIYPLDIQGFLCGLHSLL